MIKSKYLKITLLFCSFVLVACENKESQKSSGQIIAKVNEEEISIHQVNYMLSQTKGINKDNLANAKNEIAKSLVEQSIFYQQALTAKLDRDPQIMMAIEQAKRQILAKAWIEKFVSSPQKPSAQEVDQYYQDHPDLFAKHKTFKIKEILINKSNENQARINQFIVTHKNVDELAKQLDIDKIAYQVSQRVQGAETLPLEQLSTLSKLNDGQFITIDEVSSIRVIAILSATEETVDKTKAAPIIEIFLMNLQHKQSIGKIKDQAKIEYLGEFASLNDNAKTESNTTDAPKQNADDKSKVDIITKGIKGL